MNVILLSGKICSGKTTYAKSLVKQGNTVYLGTDEIMLKLFPRHMENHDEICARVTEYLKVKAVEIAKAGATVIFDGAGWQRAARQETKTYFEGNGIPCELHYVDVQNEKWQQFIENRNREVENKFSDAYYIDDGLLQKCLAAFEPPQPDEVDVHVLDGVVKR